MEPGDLTRREFTASSLMALLAGVTVTVSGCGSDGPSGPRFVDRTAAISDNHGHVAVVTAAQVMAGGAVNLDIRGVSDHPHTVQLTAADVRLIGAGVRVAQASSTDARHNHVVTFN